MSLTLSTFHNVFPPPPPRVTICHQLPRAIPSWSFPGTGGICPVHYSAAQSSAENWINYFPLVAFPVTFGKWREKWYETDSKRIYSRAFLKGYIKMLHSHHYVWHISVSNIQCTFVFEYNVFMEMRWYVTLPCQVPHLNCNKDIIQFSFQRHVQFYKAGVSLWNFNCDVWWWYLMYALPFTHREKNFDFFLAEECKKRLEDCNAQWQDFNLFFPFPFALTIALH